MLEDNSERKLFRFHKLQGVLFMRRHVHRAALAACLVCLFAVPVHSAQAIAPYSSSSQVTAPTIEVRELKTLIKKKAFFFLLDVRQPEEFAQGHIQGAVLMPLGSLPNGYRKIPKGVQLVVYCRTGHRSAQAVSFLRDHGYSKAFSLSGGYMAWSGAKRI
jgi:phage shock protein E